MRQSLAVIDNEVFWSRDFLLYNARDEYEFRKLKIFRCDASRGSLRLTLLAYNAPCGHVELGWEC